MQGVDSRGDTRGDEGGAAHGNLASFVDRSSGARAADMRAMEIRYTTSVVGDTRKWKLSKSTEMVLCPCLFVIWITSFLFARNVVWFLSRSDSPRRSTACAGIKSRDQRSSI